MNSHGVSNVALQDPERKLARETRILTAAINNYYA